MSVIVAACWRTFDLCYRRNGLGWAHVMDMDEDRIDEAVLALLWLTLHDGARAWKGYDWDTLDRLHCKGLISDPVSRAKSVVLTEAGLREAERLFKALFGRR